MSLAAEARRQLELRAILVEIYGPLASLSGELGDLLDDHSDNDDLVDAVHSASFHIEQVQAALTVLEQMLGLESDDDDHDGGGYGEDGCDS